MSTIDKFTVQERDNGAEPIEWVNPEVLKVVNHLKLLKDEIFQKRRINELVHLHNVFDVLPNFDEQLNYKGNLKDLVDIIGPHALRCAHQPHADTKSGITQTTLRRVATLLDKSLELHSYWPLSVTNNPRSPESVSAGPGVFDFVAETDNPTDSFGGAEVQKALAVLQLHHAQIAAVLGDTEVALPKEKIKKPNTQGKESVVLAKKYKFSDPPWSKQPHLRYIIDQWNKDKNHGPSRLPSDHNDQITTEGGDVAYRQDSDPAQSQTRLIRGARNGGIWYLDMQTEDVLMVDCMILGESLNSTDQVTKLKGEWKYVDSAEELRLDPNPSPRFSISVGIHQKEQTQAQLAATTGRTTHVSFDFDAIILQQGHLIENGESTKQAEWHIVNALQHNIIDNNRKPYQHNLPMVEVRPPYTQNEMPTSREIDKLISYLEKHPDLKPSELYTNATIKEIINFLGLSNCRFRPKNVSAELMKPLYDLQKRLNEKYIAPKREALLDLLQDHPLSQDQEENAKLKTIALNIFCPEFSLDDIIAIKTSEALTKIEEDGSVANGHVAINAKPLDARIQLTHPSVPLFEIDPTTGQLTYDHPDFVNNFMAEKVHGMFGTNIYNVYKLLTHHWRKGKFGAESLGEIFTGKLAYYMQVDRHQSSTGTGIRKMDRGDRFIALFETADPGPKEEEHADAFAFLTFGKLHSPKDINPSVRFRLNPEYIARIQLENSEYGKAYLEYIGEYLLKTYVDKPGEKKDILTKANYLLLRWNEVKKKQKKSSQLLTFVKLVKENQDNLRDPSPDNSTKQALRMLMLSGMIRDNDLRLNQIISP